MDQLKGALQDEKLRVKEQWMWSCDQVVEQDALIGAKEDKIIELKRELATWETPHTSLPDGGSSVEEEARGCDREDPLLELRAAVSARLGRTRRGRAPPVDPITGENEEIQLDDWLPALQRASCWSSEELLLQLVGHLQGRALQVWALLNDTDKNTLVRATEALRAHLDPGSETMVAQDFRHTTQWSEEDVASFIRRLEMTFRVAYGRDDLATETRDALLYGQAPRRAEV